MWTLNEKHLLKCVKERNKIDKKRKEIKPNEIKQAKQNLTKRNNKTKKRNKSRQMLCWFCKNTLFFCLYRLPVRLYPITEVFYTGHISFNLFTFVLIFFRFYFFFLGGGIVFFGFVSLRSVLHFTGTPNIWKIKKRHKKNINWKKPYKIISLVNRWMNVTYSLIDTDEETSWRFGITLKR